jgi:hypothetical protein
MKERFAKNDEAHSDGDSSSGGVGAKPHVRKLIKKAGLLYSLEESGDYRKEKAFRTCRTCDACS